MVTTGAAVVIDVFRAFSTTAYAVAAGAGPVVLVATLDGARERFPGALTLSDGRRSAGMDLVNSPVLLAHTQLAGRALVVRTTNGTVSALAARAAQPLLCASFVNAGATAAHLRAVRPAEVTFVASGGEPAGEDIACADYLAALLEDPRTDPAPYLARAAAAPARARLDRWAAAGHDGVHADDVTTCLRVDAAPVLLLAEPTADGDLALRS